MTEFKIVHGIVKIVRKIRKFRTIKNAFRDFALSSSFDRHDILQRIFNFSLITLFVFFCFLVVVKTQFAMNAQTIR